MILWPRLAFDHGETLLSYADRLSVLHTGRGMERLVRDLGINTKHFRSGRGEAVLAFAEAVEVPVEDANQASVRVFQRSASFRGEPISKTFLSPRVARYCPCCLAEDGDHADRRFRLIWGFRHVARCDRHSTWLLGAPCKDEVNLRLALGGERLGSPRMASPETPEYLAWLRARLTGGACIGGSWMRGQTLEQVLVASEMLGGILQHGHKVVLKKLSPEQTEEATDIGFAIYSEGPEAIEEALDTIRRRSPATAVQAGPLAYYGKLYDWLDRRSNAIDPGPIRDILRDHILKHSAVEPGTRVLGVEITDRRFHTLYSLSTAVGIERPRLSRLLKKLGEIPASATEVETGNMVFDVDKTVPLIEAFKTAIPLQDVPEYLGASHRQVEILYRARVLQPLVPRTKRGAVRNVVFGKSHLDKFLKRILDLPVLDDAAGEAYHPISYACQRGAGYFEDIFSDIFQGHILAFRHLERTGISAIYVDVGALASMKKSI
ncbi:TniQ family protein [Sulfitobacter dubius]|uniref:TniQ family protein n=1 Tax=Sulfitobacter dubius TaxID=218673 RepID=UPI0008E981DC|nr:TniQ family protein [Sulfitobacter dubius]SFH11138.1 TniQ protein [Sulfitobacter dubius]